MTKQQRKTVLVIVGIVIASYIVRSIVISAMQMAYHQQQAIRAAQRQQAKPKPAPHKAPPGVSASKAAAPAKPIRRTAPARSPSTSGNFPGIWVGRAALSGKGICDLRFELREKQDEPDHFMGYSALTCRAFAPLVGKDRTTAAARALNRVDPEAAILSGTVEKGSFEFKADKVVGTDSNGCAPTSFSLTPFGANLLAADWQEGACVGGHMILHKARS